MNVLPKTVIHVGAHLGQDQREYEKLGCKNIIWCEADSSCASYIRFNYPSATVIEGLFWSEPNLEKEFWIMDNRSQNSVFNPLNEKAYLEKVKKLTTTLDSHLQAFNLAYPLLLVLDVQGAEVEVLKGAELTLQKTKFVACEITENSSVSEFSVRQEDVEEILKKFGFKPTIRRWSYTREYYDILFIKGNKVQIGQVYLIESMYKALKNIIKFMKLIDLIHK
jgi:FkbM family methyltransferase